MRLLFLSLIFFCLSLNIYGQESLLVTGTVSDEFGPLPSTTVYIEGKTIGTETNSDGKYEIRAKKGDVLVFSFIGFETVRKKVLDQSKTIDVFMFEKRDYINEIVVTGQASGIEKKRLSTKVDIIKSEDIEKLPATQIDQLLQASTPGAQIKLSSGIPGTASTIRTRGPISFATSTSPVIIVDGVRVDNLNSNAALGVRTGGANTSALADIPMESIEKIEYIKGSAAATLYGADAANGVIQIITKKGAEGAEGLSAFFETKLGLVTANRKYLRFKRTGEALFKPGFSNEYRFGLSENRGGISYNFSGSLFNDDSFIDVISQAKKSLSFGVSSSSENKLQYRGSFSYVNFEGSQDYSSDYRTFSRYAFLETGLRGNIDELPDKEWNEIKANADEIGRLIDITRDNTRITNSNNFVYNATDNFNINATLGIDYRVSQERELRERDMLLAMRKTYLPRFMKSVRRVQNVTADLNFKWTAEKGNFSFITIFGGQFFRTNDRQSIDNARNTVIKKTGIVKYYPSLIRGEALFQNANYGLYFLENIGIGSTLFVELGARYDQNTSAGDDTEPLLLPKAGFTYNLSDHEFYINGKIKKVLNTFKFRGNYGVATNFPTAFAKDKIMKFSLFGGKPSISLGRLGNPDLKSERVVTYEGGVDLGFFKNRLNLSGTIYHSITEDALISPDPVPSEGVEVQLVNGGEIQNTGWEAEMNLTLVKTASHNLNLRSSYNFNKNVVLNTRGVPIYRIGGPRVARIIGTYVEEGKSIGFLRGVTTVEQEDGSLKTSSEFLGDTYAPHFGSMGLTYSFKTLSFFINGDYQFGGKAVDLNKMHRVRMKIDKYELSSKGVNPSMALNYFTYKSDFMKIRNIGASYSFGDKIKPFKDIRIGFSVSNPFSWTAHNFDPELTSYGISRQNGINSGGIVFGELSAPITYLSNIKFNF